VQEAPDAANLLETARQSLLTTLLPALPEHLRLEARMVARAIEIAARHAADHATPACPAGLAQEIRAGRHDNCADTLARLRADARARLAVSDPRALRA
jgi:hypothetical protein